MNSEITIVLICGSVEKKKCFFITSVLSISIDFKRQMNDGQSIEYTVKKMH